MLGCPQVNLLLILLFRAVDLHSFLSDPDPAVLLNADPDPAAFLNADPDPAAFLIADLDPVLKNLQQLVFCC